MAQEEFYLKKMQRISASALFLAEKCCFRLCQTMEPTVYAYDPITGFHPPVVPLDVRLGLTKPSSNHNLRWGILSAGKAANDFTIALKFAGHKVEAIGARDIGELSSVVPSIGVSVSGPQAQDLSSLPRRSRGEFWGSPRNPTGLRLV